MKIIDRIEAVGEKVTDVEYKEQRDADSYNTLCDLRQKLGVVEDDVTEHGSEINYLVAEVASLKAMVRELAIIIDETHVPSNENRINNLTKAYWKKIDILQEQINRCEKRV